MPNITASVGSSIDEENRASMDPQNLTTCAEVDSSKLQSSLGTVTLDCDHPIRGSVVAVYLTSQGALQLFDLQVYGYSPAPPPCKLNLNSIEIKSTEPRTFTFICVLFAFSFKFAYVN